MKSRLLLLATHPGEAASTRARLLAYEPALHEGGFEVSVQTFFPSESLPTIHADWQWIRKGRWVAAGAWRRWQALHGACYDAVVIHRELFPWGMPLGTALFLSQLRRRARRLIYDFDDAVYLPHRQHRTFIRCLEDPTSAGRLIAASDGVIAGNQHLAAYAARLNRRVECIPTPVDTSCFYPSLNGEPRAPCTLGWIGSPSTAKYLRSLAPVLERLVATHRFQLKVVGTGEPVAMRQILVDNRRWSLASEAEEFRSCDIGLYPLWDDEWSRGKCGFKALQFMASGIPVVASAIGMNTEIIADGVNGLLANTPEEWLAQLRRLLDDASLRRQMGEAARQTVEEHYALTRLAPKFVATIRMMLETRGQA